MKRIPVPDDSYRMFHFWLIEQAKRYGVLEDSNVRHGIEMTLNAIELHLGKVKRDKQIIHKEVRKFYVIYCEKFLSKYGFETTEKLSGKEIKLIQSLLDSLHKYEVSIEDYITWLFEDLYIEGNKLTAGLPLSVSNSILNKFLVSNSGKMKENSDKKRKKILSEQLQQKIRFLMREHNSPELKKLLNDFSNNDIDLNTLKLKIMAYENKLKKEQENDIT